MIRDLDVFSLVRFVFQIGRRITDRTSCSRSIESSTIFAFFARSDVRHVRCTLPMQNLGKARKVGVFPEFMALPGQWPDSVSVRLKTSAANRRPEIAARPPEENHLQGERSLRALLKPSSVTNVGVDYYGRSDFMVSA